MKDIELVIRIPEEAYKLLQTDGVDWLGAEHILNAVANGIPLSDNATNGDVIRTMFPDTVLNYNGTEFKVRVNDDNGHNIMQIYADWWDAPYKKEEKQEKIKIKTKEQVQQECEYGDVFTTEEFWKYVENGSFNEYDGEGYYHDGENETNLCVWCYPNKKGMPYVCWYNK